MAGLKLVSKGLSWLFGCGLVLLALPGYVAPPEPVAVAGAIGSGTVQVFVSGAVRRPGVYQLPMGTRVIQAIHQSGGLLPGTPVDQLALTRVLEDGEQIHVPPKPAAPPLVASAPAVAPAAVAPAGRSRSQGAAPSGGKVNLNLATAEQLDALPGIGRKRALDIIADRRKNGPYRRIDDLRRVPGVGPKLMARLKPYLHL